MPGSNRPSSGRHRPIPWRLALLALPLALGLSSCIGFRSTPPPPPEQANLGHDGAPTLQELDQLCYAFADRYAAEISSAVDAITPEPASPRQRREAHALRIEGVGAMYDIATGQDPYGKLLDLVLVTTLQSRVWIDEGWAVATFGPERGSRLAQASRRMRLEIWALAAQALTAEQLQDLDWLILDWRRGNRQVSTVSLVRFADVAADRGRSLMSQVRSGDGLLAPVSDAVEEVVRVRQLGERAFFLAKRSNYLVAWQAELAGDDLMLRPEVTAGITQIGQVAGAIDRAVAVAERLPAEVDRQRAEVLRDLERGGALVERLLGRYHTALDETMGSLTATQGLIGQSRGLSNDVLRTTESLERTLGAAERLLAVIQPAPGSATAGGKPFDIAEYVTAARELQGTLKEANRTLDSVNLLLSSQVLSGRLEEVNNAARERVDHVSQRIRELMMLMVGYGLAALAGTLALLTGNRWLNRRISDRPGSPP